jgi:hypothetical protein
MRPPFKLFRAQTRWGDVVDELIAFEPDRFSTVHNARESVKLVSKDETSNLVLSPQNINFEVDTFRSSGRTVKVESFVSEVADVWKCVNAVLRVAEIRRIGVLGEARVEVPKVSTLLLSTLTTFDAPMFPAKFSLRYEKREPTIEAVAPDIEKSDFVNTIYTAYEATQKRDEEDGDEAPGDTLNISVDYQRYYAPPLSGKDFISETRKLAGKFEQRWCAFERDLIGRKLLHEEGPQ